MTSELDIVAQTPRNVTVAGKVITIEPPTINRLQMAMLAAFDLLKKTENIDKAKAIGLKLYQEKLAAAEGDATKIDLDELKREASNIILDSVMELFVIAPPELAKLMGIICKPNGKGASVPEPFGSADFWVEEATVSEAVAVISTFIALIDIAPLLKNVRALKGIA